MRLKVKETTPKKLAKRISSHIDKCFKTKKGQLRHFPNMIIALTYFMSLNILLQGILDLVIKFSGYTPWIISMPWRIDYLFLTTISVLMGFQTLNGMLHQKLDVTRNSIQIGLLVETALVIGDLHFISVYSQVLPEVFWFRMPFVVLTLMNICILLYVIFKMGIFWNRKKHAIELFDK